MSESSEYETKPVCLFVFDEDFVLASGAATNNTAATTNGATTNGATTNDAAVGSSDANAYSESNSPSSKRTATDNGTHRFRTNAGHSTDTDSGRDTRDDRVDRSANDDHER